MKNLLEAQLSEELDQWRRADRLRLSRSSGGPSRIHVPAPQGGPPLISFCSNDYLGFATHPEVREAARRCLEQTGFGSGGPRLLSGTFPEHLALEEALATFLQRPDALLFSTGYHANLAAVTALAGPQDLIVSDAANHASLIDGCRLSRARIEVYRHLDAQDADRALSTPGSFRRRFLITESLFSMDGDLAPLKDLATVSRQHQAVFMVDEAHALGVMGPGGRGLAAHLGVEPDLLVGTFGKALGSFGAFIAGSTVLKTYLLNRARTFLFTTAPPAPVAAAALAALTLLQSPEGDERRRLLQENIRLFRTGLQSRGETLTPIATPIVPLPFGTDLRAVQAAEHLLNQGFFVPAVRPPTVPEGTARLRVTFSAEHTPEMVRRLLDALVPLRFSSTAPTTTSPSTSGPKATG